MGYLKKSQGAYIFAKKADPHGGSNAAHVHTEDGLYEGVGNASWIHTFPFAVLRSLKPAKIFGNQ